MTHYAERFFKLKENGTTVRTEVVAGVTTFMTMSYILAVNPNILAAAGMEPGSVFTATILASAIASFCMALLANLPFVLSAGMGLNAYFAYTVVIGMGYSWRVALAAVFVEGLVFLVLSLTHIREAIFNAIPVCLKMAVSIGIGMFLCFIGLQNANIVTDAATLVGLFPFRASLADGTFHSAGMSAILALTGTLITAFFVIKGIRGHLLAGIVLTWLTGIVCELAGWYVPAPEAGYYSVIPRAFVSMPASMKPTLFRFDFSVPFMEFAVIVFAFLFVDVFDTLGTLIGCASKAGMLDRDGKLPRIRGALLADSIGTTVGACFGTSTVTTFVESSSGIAEGGRTGLTSVVAGALFLLSLFLSPLFLTIPSFATAPALIIVGFFMMQQVSKIDWSDLLKAVPAFFCITSTAFMYSISDGIAAGIISYTVLHLVTGKAKEVSALMYVLTVVFVFKYILI